MSKVKVYKTGINRKTGRMGVDLSSGQKYEHTAVKAEDVILVRDIKQLIAEEPGATLERLLELTK